MNISVIEVLKRLEIIDPKLSRQSFLALHWRTRSSKYGKIEQLKMAYQLNARAVERAICNVDAVPASNGLGYSSARFLYVSTMGQQVSGSYGMSYARYNYTI
ncbi:MAG: hypothetical protein ACI9O6_000900 [Glaciecola sp.]|jgi:hypothetical protein